MIKQSFVKSKKKYKVSFEVPTDRIGKGRDVRVLGTFNGWSWDKGLAMTNGGGTYKADIELAPGDYQFRYLVDNQEWQNDWEAQGYTASGYNSDNCLLELAPVATSAPAKKAAAKKPAAKKATAKPAAKKATVKPAAEKAAAKPAAKKSAAAKVATKPVAKKAATKKQIAKKVTAAADDLKKIEGIGPKIAGLLNDAGINTFVALSKASEKKLADVLEAAGARYRLAKPDTWQEQAKLAAAGKYDELKTLQDELKGGRRK